jgi:hypothetical protein
MSGLKLKVAPQFPAQVVGGAGIDVVKANGNYSFALDYTDFPQIAALPPDVVYALIFDPVTGKYLQVPISLLTGGVPGTVATLPSPTQGLRRFVSDATVTTFASVVAGGGSNPVPVYSDGAAWRIG